MRIQTLNVRSKLSNCLQKAKKCDRRINEHTIFDFVEVYIYLQKYRRDFQSLKVNKIFSQFSDDLYKILDY